jgi:hypothetical protein
VKPHCYYCGRGLSIRQRATLTPEDRLILAIFNQSFLLCRACAPILLARNARQAKENAR